MFAFFAVCGTHKLKVLIEEKTQQIFEETEAHEKLNELLHELEMKRKPLIPAVELFERFSTMKGYMLEIQLTCQMLIKSIFADTRGI